MCVCVSFLRRWELASTAEGQVAGEGAAAGGEEAQPEDDLKGWQLVRVDVHLCMCLDAEIDGVVM